MGRVAVIGPNHAIARLGGYSSVPKQAVSLIGGLRAIAPDADFVTAQGVFITTSEDRAADAVELAPRARNRSEEHTSELQSLMRISYAVFCLKKKKKIHTTKQ